MRHQMIWYDWTPACWKSAPQRTVVSDSYQRLVIVLALDWWTKTSHRHFATLAILKSVRYRVGQKVIPLIQCNIFTRGITFLAHPVNNTWVWLIYTYALHTVYHRQRLTNSLFTDRCVRATKTGSATFSHWTSHPLNSNSGHITQYMSWFVFS